MNLVVPRVCGLDDLDLKVLIICEFDDTGWLELGEMVTESKSKRQALRGMSFVTRRFCYLASSATDGLI